MSRMYASSAYYQGARTVWQPEVYVLLGQNRWSKGLDYMSSIWYVILERDDVLHSQSLHCMIYGPALDDY